MIFLKKVGIIFLIIAMFISFDSFAECECGVRPDEDIRQVRANIIKTKTEGYLPSTVYETANGYMESINKYGFWDDIDYDTSPGTWFPAVVHLARLMDIARAYHVPNQPLFESDEIPKLMEKALPIIEERFFKHASDGSLQTHGNWWYWNLYIPERLGFILLCMQDKIDKDIFNTSLNTIYFCLRNPYDFYLVNMYGDGANSANALRGNLYYGVLSKQNENLQIVAQSLCENLKMVERPADGIREDASYTQHVMLDYYQYYKDYINATAEILNFYKDTKFFPTGEYFDMFSYCLCEGATWTVFQEENHDLALTGRVIDGPYGTRNIAHIVSALKIVADTKGQYQARAQDLLLKYQSGLNMQQGHKYFYQGDFTVHRKGDTYISLRMSSPRTKPAEAWSGQGFSTLFQGDGYLQVFDDKDEFFKNQYAITAMDYTRPAGTTTLRNNTPVLFDANHWSAEPFAGGTSDSEYGVSAMVLSQLSYPLRAQKSWFFFDDEIVCLGSGIESDNKTDEVHTNIDQRPINQGSMIIDGKTDSSAIGNTNKLNGVSWIYNNGIGYYFPGTTDLILNKETREGSWYSLNTNSDKTTGTMDFSQLWINHGVNPSDETYSYAVLPAFTSAKIKSYAENPDFEILVQSDTVHAVHDNSTNSTGMVFWPVENEFLSAKLSYDTTYFNGIYPRAADPRSSKTITAEVKGKKGRANAYDNYGVQGFAVNEQRIGTNDVDIRITWFDDKSAPNGSWWYIKYYDSNGNIQSTETIPYTYTDTWKETTIRIPDISFGINGIKENSDNFDIVHSNAVIDLSNEKYQETIEDWIDISTRLYGPLIHSVKIYPHGQIPSSTYIAEADGIKVDNPCVVYKRVTDNGISLNVSEPMQQDKTIKLIIDGVYTSLDNDENITVYRMANNKTMVSVKTQKGRTYNINLIKG